MSSRQRGAPFAEIRVLDFGQFIAGPLAAMLLADQGADVLRIDRPGRRITDEPLDAVLQRNKSRITLDLKTETGLQKAAELINNADILIENFRPGIMDRLGLGSAACRVRNPRLIYLSLPGFASKDAERAHIPGWEGVIGAAAGLFTNISFSREFLGLPPVYTSLPLASVYGAVHGAIGAAMALLARERNGQGDHIEVPLASALLAAMGANLMTYADHPERYDNPPVPRAYKERELPALRSAFSSRGKEGVRAALEFAAQITPPMMCTYKCGDGRLLYVFAMDHRRMSLRLLDELGIRHLFDERLVERDPYLPTSIDNSISDVGTLGRELKSELRHAMSVAFASAPALIWEDRLNKAGIPCAVHRSTAEWLQEPHVRASGIGVEVVDSHLGAMLQPGPAIWLESNPTELLSPRPRATVATWSSPWLKRVMTSSAATQHQASIRGCLAGIKVLDLTTMIAGPSCGRTLAEYGADVIKIDAVAPYLGPRMTIWYSAEVNRGKRSSLIDLKHPAGREAFLRLVENADVVLHNMRPGVMNSLGLSTAELRKRKSDIVECALSAFDGPRAGPWSSRPGYDPVVQAATGITIRYGTAEAPELHAIASTIDYLTGFFAAFGIATALFKREAIPGEGITVRASLAQSAMYAQLPFSYSFAGRSWNEPSGQDATGWSPRSRLHRAADGWVFVHFDDVAFARFQPSLVGDANGSDKDELLSRWIAERTMAEVVGELQLSGAGVHRVTNLATIRECYEASYAEFDPATFAGTFAVLKDADHPSGTTVRAVAPLHARLAGNPLRVGAPSEKHGHSTVAILKEIGFDSQDVRSLQQEGVVATLLSLPYLPN